MRLRLSPVWREVWECLVPLAIAIAAIGALLLITLLREPVEDAYELAIHSTNIPDLSGMARIEFLLNRYQTLLTGIFAIIAAWMIVRAMRQQIQTQQRDTADLRLTEYAVAISQCHLAWQAFRGAVPDLRMQAFEALRQHYASATILAATVDPIMGKDRNMVSLFINRMAADVTQAGEKSDTGADQLIWTLFLELTNAIEKRRRLLEESSEISPLYSMAIINEEKYRQAIATGQPVTVTG